MKKLGTVELKAEVKELQREVQRKLRQSHWKYMGNLSTEPTQEQAEEGAMPCMKMPTLSTRGLQTPVYPL